MSAGPDTTNTAASTLQGAGRRRVRRLVLAFGAVRGDLDAVVLDSQAVILGRDPSATFSLDDDQVSRQHARIAIDGGSGEAVLADLESRNGTFVDGVRTKSATLHPGAIVRVGRTIFVYSEADLGDPAWLRPEAAPLFGPSLAMQRVRGEIERIAAEPVPVLVLGQTGVGKELVASELHVRSGRKGAFVPVNCAAIPESVAEAEFFGHEPGAFTGAAQRREGLLVSAHGGTLFLDEVGDMPAAVQPKLLRALALGEVRPVGASRARKVDVRVVAATNRDLDAAERDGSFRSDLLSRLAGWTIRIPPLRERREDILPLASRYLDGRPGRPELSASAAEALLLHDFPHNVRELEHLLGAALTRWSKSGPITREHLGDHIAMPVRDRTSAVPLEATPPAHAGRPSMEELCEALERCRGNLAKVAAMYGKDRHQVYRWIERYKLDVESFRDR
jgi:transcriptional regulator with GAF, ATPase, and Fis domain